MKTVLRRIGIFAVAVIFAFSCSKPGSVYDGTSWFTETGQYSSTTLTFRDEARKCMVLENAGECGLGFEYEVEWSGRNSFKLIFKENGQIYVSYSGEINGEVMTLKELLKTENQTYELRKTH